MDKLKGMIFAALFAALTGAVAWFKIPLPFTPVPITLQTLAVLLSGAMLGAYYGGISMIIYLILGAIGLPVFAGGSSGFASLLGPSGGYLLSYPVASFAVGKMAEKKNIASFAKYFSFAAIMILVAAVVIDGVFSLGIMKLSGKSMVEVLSQSQRIFLVAIGLILLGGLAYLSYYLSRKNEESSNIMMGMFAGTLIIYAMGAIQGKFVTSLPWSAVFVGWVLPFILGDVIKLVAALQIAKSIDMKKYMK